MSKDCKQSALSAPKLLAWVESELRKTEQLISGENNSGRPDLEVIREFEGRIWAYTLLTQFVQSGGADEEGAVCGACGGTKMLVMTGQLVCRQCYESHGSECSMVPASSEEGKLAVQRRRSIASPAK